MKTNKTTEPTSKSFNWNKLIKHIAVVVSIGFVVNLLIIYFTTEKFSLNQLLLFDTKYIFIAFLLGISPIFLHAYSIYIWVRCFDKHITFKAATKISASTLIGSAVTPTMIGGGPLKMGMLMRHKLTAGQAAAVTSLGGIQDFIAMAFFITLSLLFSKRIGMNVMIDLVDKLYSNSRILILFLVGIAIISFATYWIAHQTNLGKKIIQKARESMSDFKHSYAMVVKRGKMYFLTTTLINIVRWSFIHLVLIFLLLGLSLNLDYWDIFLSEWLVFTGMTATPLPGGSGGAETIFFLVYKSVIPIEFIGVLILVWRFFTDYTKLILSAILMVVLQNTSIKD